MSLLETSAVSAGNIIADNENSSMDKDDRLIVPESSLILWTRDFYLGDTVKLSLASAESARVIETRQEVKVNHIGGDVYDQWIPANRLIPTTHFQKGSRVAYKNWIGTVEGVLLLGMIRTDCGKFCKVLDPFGIATVGDPYDVSGFKSRSSAHTRLGLFF